MTAAKLKTSKRRTADDWPDVIKLFKAELKRAAPCSFNQFCIRHDVDCKLLRKKIGDLAEVLNVAHSAAVAREEKKMAISIADRLIAEAKVMRNAGICITRRALARRLGEKRNNKVFVSGWKLATAASHEERHGSRALQLTRRPTRRR